MFRLYLMALTSVLMMLAVALSVRAETEGEVDPPPPVPTAQTPVPSPPRSVGWLPSPQSTAPSYQLAAEPVPAAPVVRHAGPICRTIGNFGAILERARWDTVRYPPAPRPLPVPAPTPAPTLYRYVPVPVPQASPQAPGATLSPWYLSPPPAIAPRVPEPTPFEPAAVLGRAT